LAIGNYQGIPQKKALSTSQQNYSQFSGFIRLVGARPLALTPASAEGASLDRTNKKRANKKGVQIAPPLLQIRFAVT
jgi:hypothetical protein